MYFLQAFWYNKFEKKPKLSPISVNTIQLDNNLDKRLQILTTLICLKCFFFLIIYLHDNIILKINLLNIIE